MSAAETLSDIDYPESDGMPMGETDIHKKWMIRIYDLLTYRYRGQRVYVGSDLLLYYTEGVPYDFVVPDEFVVLDCEPGERRTFQTWKEGRIPNVVLEITSRYTKRKDQVHKPRTYAQIGVKELFLYDPTGDYLKPRLQGYRLEEGQPTRLEPDPSGALECRELGLLLRLEKRRLVMVDRATGQVLLTEAEAAWAAQEAEQAAREREQAAREREQAAREKEQTARQAAEARAEAAEAELRRLREQMARQQQHDG
jgi:Uma2 family endonuclease